MRSRSRVCCRVGEEPDALIYEKLPHDIANRHVLIMDPILGTGNTVARAIQVYISLRLLVHLVQAAPDLLLFWLCMDSTQNACIPLFNVTFYCAISLNTQERGALEAVVHAGTAFEGLQASEHCILHPHCVTGRSQPRLHCLP